MQKINNQMGTNFMDSCHSPKIKNQHKSYSSLIQKIYLSTPKTFSKKLTGKDGILNP